MLFVSSVLFVFSPGAQAQENTADLLKKLSDGEPADQQAAADALVKKGTSIRSAVLKALDKAPADRKPRHEDVLLRIDAGTDASSAAFGALAFDLREAAAVQEPNEQIKVGLRLKAIFEGNATGDKPLVLTITRATIVTLKGRSDMIVRGSKGEPFARTFDPQTPKMFEYGAILPPRHPPGTRVVLVFEVECGGVKKLLRSPLLTIEEKK